MKRTTIILIAMILVAVCAGTCFAERRGGPHPPPRPPGVDSGFDAERPPPPPVLLTPEQEAKLLVFIREICEFKYNRLMDLKEFRPDKYHRILGEAERKRRNYLRLQRKFPDRAERLMEIKRKECRIEELADERRTADLDQKRKDQIRAELATILSELFDLKAVKRQEKISDLEKKLADLKDQAKKRNANKAELISTRLDQILGEKAWMDW